MNPFEFLYEAGPPSFFHAHDGWFFGRLEDGIVKVVYHPHPESKFGLSMLFTKDEWASIISHVSAAGGTAESFQEARKFNDGS